MGFKKYSFSLTHPVLAFCEFDVDFDKLTPPVGTTAPSYRSHDGKTHFRLVAMASHRRQGLGAPPLKRGTAAHAHQPSNGTRQPAFGRGDRARCSGTCTRSAFLEHIRTHTGCPEHATLDVRCGTAPSWCTRAMCDASGRFMRRRGALH